MFIFLSIFFLFLILFMVVFLVLLERFMLSLTQNRLGPETSFMGIFQSFFDGTKLLKKSNVILKKMNMSLFFMVLFLFFISFFFYFLLNFFFKIQNDVLYFLVFLVLIGWSVFIIMLTSFISKSKYSILGSIRFCNQSLSFEIVFFFWMFIMMYFSKSLNYIFFSLFYFLMFFWLFMIIILSEMNRIPMDLSEGESELVSGFNTEFMGVIFILLFLSEYSMIIFFSIFLNNLINMNFNFLMITFLVILFRCCFPRMRLDCLMSMFWMKILPFILVFFSSFYLFFFY